MPLLSPPTYNFRTLSILVVEDNDFMRTVVCQILNRLGLGRLYSIENGREAKNVMIENLRLAGRAKDIRIDIVMSDWVMPDMDGLELLSWVRSHKDERICFLPYIMMSAYTETSRIKKARDAGMTEFLAKPMSLQTIAHRLTSVIEEPRPFIQTESFFGPDRRRKNIPFPGPDRRKNAATDTTGDQRRRVSKQMA